MILHVAKLDVESTSSDDLKLLLQGMEDALQGYQNRFPLGLAEMPIDADRIRTELARQEQAVQHA